MVPRQLSNLPLDILNEILIYLLPPLTCANNESSSLCLLTRTPDPLDLFQVMCTCRALHDVVLPWVYRRLHFSSDASATGRWKYIRDHPEASIHVRLFIVDYWCLYLDERRKDIASLLPAMRLMVNLQFLILIPGIEGISIMSQTAKELVSKPRLEALVTFSPLPAPDMPFPHSLRHLSLRDEDDQSDWVLQAIPQLESLSIGSHDQLQAQASIRLSVQLQTLPISWDRLRSIDLHRFIHWRGVLDSFAAWNRTSNALSPLVEVLIDAKLSSSDCWALIDTIKGQNLQILALSYVSSIGETFIRRLAQAFPQLRMLRLSTSPLLSVWDVGFSVIAETLESLEVLTLLQWNYIDVPRQPTSSEDPLLHHLASKMSVHSHSLKRVQFHHYTKVYSFVRSEDGGFVEEESVSRFRNPVEDFTGPSWAYGDAFAMSTWNGVRRFILVPKESTENECDDSLEVIWKEEGK